MVGVNGDGRGGAKLGSLGPPVFLLTFPLSLLSLLKRRWHFGGTVA